MKTKSLFETLTRRYYKSRLWKITTVRIKPRYAINIGSTPIIKFYENRIAIGEPWQYVRSIREEVA